MTIQYRSSFSERKYMNPQRELNVLIKGGKYAMFTLLAAF